VAVELCAEKKSLWPGGQLRDDAFDRQSNLSADHSTTVRRLLAALSTSRKRSTRIKWPRVQSVNVQLKKETGKSLKDEVIQKAMARIVFTWDPSVPH